MGWEADMHDHLKQLAKQDDSKFVVECVQCPAFGAFRHGVKGP